ncbi:TrmB family transcriptional regulator [Haloplanus salilacus]|uniref:TrmB family transcriptional regulator n=1 Tax=Haloplanus salilacus TaxID=2949994 RepID=UPI0030CD5C0F
MTAQPIERSTDRIAVPDDLSAAESKLVYLFVATSGGATVDDLQSSLDIKRMCLFPVLETLSERGLIERTGDAYVPTAT